MVVEAVLDVAGVVGFGSLPDVVEDVESDVAELVVSVSSESPESPDVLPDADPLPSLGSSWGPQPASPIVVTAPAKIVQTRM